MSIRAYRVVEIVKDSAGVSFNDEAIARHLPSSFWDRLDNDCCGLTELHVDTLKKISKVKELPSDIRADFQRMVKDAEKKGDDYVQFYCY